VLCFLKNYLLLTAVLFFSRFVSEELSLSFIY
jgi:hypothetical protein